MGLLVSLGRSGALKLHKDWQRSCVERSLHLCHLDRTLAVFGKGLRTSACTLGALEHGS